MPRTLRFALVGLDHWYSAIPLAEQLAAHPDTELLLIADRDGARAAELGARLGIPSTDDFDLALDDPRVDVIASFVSAEQNPGVCIRGAEAGKSIVSVKPIALTSADARLVAAAVDAAGVRLIPSESRPRSSPLGAHLQRVAREQSRGSLISAHFAVNGHPPTSWPGASDGGWWLDPLRTPGGAWIDHAIYDIDRVRWLLGEEPLTATGHMTRLVHRELALEDFGLAYFTFPSGAVASMEHTWSAAPGAGRIAATFTFEGGTVTVDSIDRRMRSSQPIGSDPAWDVALAPDDTPSLDSLLAELRAEAHTLGTAPDALANLLACEAAYRSSETGQTTLVERH